MIKQLKLSKEEETVLNLLAETWNTYLTLPKYHSDPNIFDDQTQDFRFHIHALQRLIKARTVRWE